MQTGQGQCFHCGLPNPIQIKFSADVLNAAREFCCLGCLSVAQTIVENNLEAYYIQRTALPKTADTLIPEQLSQLDLYDETAMQAAFISQQTLDLKETVLILEGISCAACCWLNERHLKQLRGVQHVHLNYTNHRVKISWIDTEIKLSHILYEIKKLGYTAHPYSIKVADNLRQQQRKTDLIRLSVAGFSGAQVMMIAIALYAGAKQGLTPEMAILLRWISLIISIPAVFYAAMPFYRAAFSGIKTLKFGMDVPISLGILAGFFGSTWVVILGHGVVYFDTITMLIFFLLATRYFEKMVRQKSIEGAENLMRLSPQLALRNNSSDTTPVLLAINQLKIGDRILVRPGETIPVDGFVVEGTSTVDESLLTGESRALAKSLQDHVLAGSVNYEHPLTIQVKQLNENTVLASISRLLERALNEKPVATQFADKVAGYFTYGLLLFVLLVGFTWWLINPAKTFEIILTVLVVSCPCALSLAAPAAFAAAGSSLVKRGILITRGHALETLANIQHIVFDKTGTLTFGKPILSKIQPLASLDRETCLNIAKCLEAGSEHPIAKAFLQKNNNLQPVKNRQNIAGQGISGEIENETYFLGNAQHHSHITRNLIVDPVSTTIWLSNKIQLLCKFTLQDSEKPNAQQLISRLKKRQIGVSLWSGDHQEVVEDFANRLNIQDFQAECSPAKKLVLLKALQKKKRVCMIGDGINDAPVLSAADIAIAMGSGTDMARVSADIVLLNENLDEIIHALQTAKSTKTIIKQNFFWAIGYNLIALPFAALGFLSPWMAAIGMSVSSLIVVLNALRLSN